MILHGDCLDELKKLPDNSIDSVVTDPPYGLSKEPDIVEVLTKWMNGEDYIHRSSGFMGKSWDSFVPGPSIWKEVYRVLKPGGHVLCFVGTRTQDLMTISLRLAGFEVRDVIEWLYATGFPKSLDVGKAFDKRKGGRLLVDEVCSYLRQKRDEKGYTNKQIDDIFGFKGMAGHWFGLPSNSQNAIPRKQHYERLKQLLDLDDRYDELIEAAERERIGEKNTKDFSHHKGSMMSKETTEDWSTKTTTIDITAPATDLAKKWDGWGTNLKPAHEPIILCRKPLEKNVAYNVEKWGTGGLNIDGCRIFDNEFQPKERIGATKLIANRPWNEKQTDEGRPIIIEGNEKGRFPANCVTLDDDQFYSKYFNITPKELSKKASKKDRNSDWLGNEIQGNKHPTVKPVDLMAWLIKLITPPGGIVLDPFAGSGSTLVAAKREGFSYVGIEKEAEYIPIIKARTETELLA